MNPPSSHANTERKSGEGKKNSCSEGSRLCICTHDVPPPTTNTQIAKKRALKTRDELIFIEKEKQHNWRGLLHRQGTTDTAAPLQKKRFLEYSALRPFFFLHISVFLRSSRIHRVKSGHRARNKRKEDEALLVPLHRTKQTNKHRHAATDATARRFFFFFYGEQEREGNTHNSDASQRAAQKHETGRASKRRR
jgi:hypothetical protein